MDNLPTNDTVASVHQRDRVPPYRFRHIATLLKSLQVPSDDVVWCKQANFWANNSYRLEYLYRAAESGYKTIMRRVHPDVEGGSVEKATELNKTWKFIKKQFAKRGIPG